MKTATEKTLTVLGNLIALTFTVVITINVTGLFC